MKLCFSTLGCPDWDFDTIIKNAGDLGFQGIEIRGVKDVLAAHLVPELLAENQTETKENLEKNGVRICALATSAVFHDPAKYAASMDEGRKAVDLCRQMDIPFVRVLGDRMTAGSRLTEGLRALCDYAQGTPRVLLEVHGDFITAEALTPVIDALGAHKAFGLLWDIGHSDVVYGKDYKVFYSLIRPCIHHVHIKDHIVRAGRVELVKMGEGDIPVADIVKTLLNDGFEGYFSFEWEKRWEQELEEPEIMFPQFVRYMNGLNRR